MTNAKIKATIRKGKKMVLIVFINLFKKVNKLLGEKNFIIIFFNLFRANFKRYILVFGLIGRLRGR